MTKTVTVNKTTNVVEVQSSGTVGPTGATGATGATGPQGPQGPGGVISSVAVTGSDGIQVDSGSPITTSSGTIALGVDASALRTHINVEDGANNYTLPNATASAKGGVIVNTGSGLNISNGTISLGGHSHTNAGFANSGFMSSADKNKLDAIEANATADQTGAEIKTAYEAESDTNAYTDAEKTKLAGIATGAEVNVNADWNASSGDAEIQNKPTIPSGNQIIDWTASGAGTIHSTNIPAIALTSIQTASSESAQLSLTTQEGDVVIRTDQNRSYMKNSGSAGTMADFTEILTPTDYVSASSGGTFSGNVNFTGNVTQNNASLATTGKAIAMAMVFG